MELSFLGRGSAFNIKEGNTSAFIKNDNTLFLIDCGSNIFERVLNANLLNNVKKVYIAITHRHPDHIGSLGDLIFHCYYKLGITPQIYRSDCGIKDFLLSCGVTGDKYCWFYGNIESLNINIESIYANHCGIFKDNCGGLSEKYYESDNPVNIFECNSFIITYNGIKMFYSGDCSYVDFWDNKVNQCDEFYLDCCIANYPNNIHQNVNALYNNLYGECGKEIDKSKIYCMHFDCDEAIVKAKELGFNVVKNIK